MAIYFIQSAGGPIKIGYTTKDPLLRLKSLQTSNPYKLELLGSMGGTLEDEAAIHREFEGDNISGDRISL